MNQLQPQSKDLFVITCPFHKKNPLGESLRCSCRVLQGEEAKEARLRWKMRSSGVLKFNGGPFLRSTFGFVGFLPYKGASNIDV